MTILEMFRDVPGELERRIPSISENQGRPHKGSDFDLRSGRMSPQVGRAQ